MTFDPAAAGWTAERRDEFPHLNGPIWEKRENGARIFGLLADRRHANDRGVVHGGMLMTFADQSLGELVLDSVARNLCATIQLNTHFLRRASGRLRRVAWAHHAPDAPACFYARHSVRERR